jgi:hypothetical protein
MAANALDRQLTQLEAIRYRFGRNEAAALSNCSNISPLRASPIRLR